MNIKQCRNVILLVFMVSVLNACAFIPKTITATKSEQSTCDMATSEWDLDVVALFDSNSHCDSEGCLAVLVAVPVVTFAVSLPIVAIGNSIHFIERQFRCN